MIKFWRPNTLAREMGSSPSKVVRLSSKLIDIGRQLASGELHNIYTWAPGFTEVVPCAGELNNGGPFREPGVHSLGLVEVHSISEPNQFCHHKPGSLFEPGTSFHLRRPLAVMVQDRVRALSSPCF